LCIIQGAFAAGKFQRQDVYPHVRGGVQASGGTKVYAPHKHHDNQSKIPAGKCKSHLSHSFSAWKLICEKRWIFVMFFSLF
jgi:hypothetical protein